MPTCQKMKQGLLIILLTLMSLHGAAAQNNTVLTEVPTEAELFALLEGQNLVYIMLSDSNSSAFEEAFLKGERLIPLLNTVTGRGFTVKTEISIRGALIAITRNSPIPIK